jgi:hypothetical protein
MGIQILAYQMIQNHQIYRHFMNPTLKFKGFRGSPSTTGDISGSGSSTINLSPVASESTSHQPTVKLSISETTIKLSEPAKAGIQNNDEDDACLLIVLKLRVASTTPLTMLLSPNPIFCCFVFINGNCEDWYGDSDIICRSPRHRSRFLMNIKLSLQNQSIVLWSKLKMLGFNKK